MKFLVGDDTGILKWVRVEAQKIERFGPQRRGDAAELLCHAGPSGDREARIVVAYASGILEMRDAVTGQVLAAATTAPNVRRVEAFGSGLLSVSSDGSSHIIEEWCGENYSTLGSNPENNGCRATVGHKGHATVTGEPPSIGKEDAAPARSFTLPGPVADAKIDPCGSHRLAFGGNDNDLKLYDLEKGEVCWRAKGTRENFLCLRIPNRISTLQWATGLAPSRSLLLSSTSDAKIRLYDASAQRRPLFELQIGFGAGQGTGGHTGTLDDIARPIMSSALSQRGNSWSLFVGNTVGVLREYDLRMLPGCQKTEIPPGRKSHLKWAHRQLPFKRGYKGMMGSIRAVDVHCSGEALVAVGLGRFAYVYETQARKMVSKVYLKQKLCSVLFSNEERQGRKDDSENEESEAENDTHKEGLEAERPEEQDIVQEGFSDDDEFKGDDENVDATNESKVTDEESAAENEKAPRKKKKRRVKGQAKAVVRKKKQRTDES